MRYAERRKLPYAPEQLFDLVADIESTGAEGVDHLVAELVLIANQRIDGKIEKSRDQVLDRIAVETDQLAEEGDGQQVLALVLLLDARLLALEGRG